MTRSHSVARIKRQWTTRTTREPRTAHGPHRRAYGLCALGIWPQSSAWSDRGSGYGRIVVIPAVYYWSSSPKSATAPRAPGFKSLSYLLFCRRDVVRMPKSISFAVCDPEKVDRRVRGRSGGGPCAAGRLVRPPALPTLLSLRAGQRTGGGASGMPGRSAPPSPARESRSVRVPLGPPSLLALPGTPFR